MTQGAKITEGEAQAALDASIRFDNGFAAAEHVGTNYQVYRRRLDRARRLGMSPASVERPRHRVPAIYVRAPDPKPEGMYSPPPPPEPASDELIRVLAIGDAHDDPYLPKTRFQWIGRHAAAVQPDRIVQIGDICDVESLSFHSGNDTEAGRFKPRFLADMQSLDQALETLMEPIAQAPFPMPRFDITLGNHENRIWRFEDSAPETSGMLQAEFSAKLHRYDIHFHRYGQTLMVGGVGFTHAPFSVMGKPIGGMTASQTVARQALHDWVSGHTHKANLVTAPKVGDDNKVTIIDLGCALPEGHIQNYAKHTTTGWWWGCWELLIRNGRITGWHALPMSELARRYG